MTIGRPRKSTERTLSDGELRRLRERRADGMTIAELAGLHGLPAAHVGELVKDVEPPKPVSTKRQAPKGLTRWSL